MPIDVSASLAMARLPFIPGPRRLRSARRSRRPPGWYGLRLGGALIVASVLAGCGGPADTRPAEWSYISAVIIQPSCATANCHSQLAQRSGVTLDSTFDGYDQLVNRHFVIPEKPESSALVGLLRGQGSRRMPPNFPLPDLDIQLIETWIEHGAKWDLSVPRPMAVTP